MGRESIYNSLISKKEKGEELNSIENELFIHCESLKNFDEKAFATEVEKVIDDLVKTGKINEIGENDFTCSRDENANGGWAGKCYNCKFNGMEDGCDALPHGTKQEFFILSLPVKIENKGIANNSPYRDHMWLEKYKLLVNFEIPFTANEVQEAKIYIPINPTHKQKK